ncbi:HIT family protein [archaeon]|jgi:histidine triad (HIT) family protein|nr:HIT family protein [archaeon]MBT6762413.1 HIT family protein [archaeon]
MVSDYELIGQGRGYTEVVFENDRFVAFVQEKAISPGQITIIPREKYTIFEMLPSQMLAELSTVIKTVSEAVFETLKCHGTNVLIENGISAGQDQPVLSIHIIPRFTDDGLPLDWEAKQIEEYDMEDAMVHLTSNKIRLGDDIVASEDSDIEVADGVEIVDDKKKAKKEENYLIKSLRKIP